MVRNLREPGGNSATGATTWRVMFLYFLRMILSENRFPLFRIMRFM
jgi:hypothetical protein